MSLKLTDRQRQVLDLIRQCVTQTGRPPTRAEIAQELGFRSANAAEDHLRALAKKGYIRIIPSTSRGIQLTDAALLLQGPAVSQAPQVEAAPLAVAPENGRSAMIFKSRHGAANAAEFNAAALLMLPLVGRVAAGNPILAAEHIEQEIPLPHSIFPASPDYLLRVSGMSMRDAGILDGDLLAVQKASTARHGQTIVARLGDEVTVKQLHHQGNNVQLLPANPDFSPVQIGPADDFHIEGIAVGLIRGSH